MEPNGQGDTIIFPEEITKLRLFSSGQPGNEKFHLKSINDDKIHYTLHLGTKSHYLDIHIKNEETGEYKTLFEMHHFSFARMMVVFLRYFKYATIRYAFSKRINLGRLKRYNCVLVKVDLDKDLSLDEDFLTVKQTGRHTKMKFNGNVMKAKLDGMVIEPDDILQSNCGCFQVYKTKNNNARFIGYIYRHPHNMRSRRFFFVSKGRFQFIKALLHHGITQGLRSAQFADKDKILKDWQSKMAERYRGTTIYARLKKDMKYQITKVN
jgi:hypothetical protein